MDDLEQQFHRAMIRMYERARDEADYQATRFIQMVGEHGGAETARRLVTASVPSEGFTKLWERGKLGISVEATMLRPEFRQLFTTDELRAARRRLREYGFEAAE